MKKRAVWAFEWIGEVFICLIMHGNQNYDNWQKTFIRNSFSRFKRICQNSVKSHKKKRSSQSLPFDLCIDVNLFRVRKSELGSMFYEICTISWFIKKVTYQIHSILWKRVLENFHQNEMHFFKVIIWFLCLWGYWIDGRIIIICLRILFFLRFFI